MLPCSLGAEYGRLVCSVEETKIVYSLLSCVQHMLLEWMLDCHGNRPQKTILFHFPFHTGELSNTSSDAHGRDAPTESRHSNEEQSTPAVKRKCTRDEDITTQG